MRLRSDHTVILSVIAWSVFRRIASFSSGEGGWLEGALPEGDEAEEEDAEKDAE